MSQRLRLSMLLLGMGAAWGLSQPLSKIATSGSYRPFGLIFWELVFLVIMLTGFQLARGRKLGLAGGHWPLYLAIAILGTVFPNYISFRSYSLMPAGVMSIIIAIVPMFSVPVAIVMGVEKPTLGRLAGVLVGAIAVGLLVGPNAGLPAGISVWFVLTALLGPLSYAIEGNYLARRGTGGLDAVQVLLGASLIGLMLSLPLMFVTGQQFTIFKAWDVQIWALLGSTVVHAIAYSGYVWIVGRAGPVFASQVSYLVTATGVLWSMLILGETYSGWIWAAFALMMVGVALVNPKPPDDAVVAVA